MTEQVHPKLSFYDWISTLSSENTVNAAVWSAKEVKLYGYITIMLINYLVDFCNYWITAKEPLTMLYTCETKEKWRAPPTRYYGNYNF